MTVSMNEVEKAYISAVKSLLGVRVTTCSGTIMIESEVPSLSERITKRTAAFLKKKLLGDHADRTPLQKIYKICEAKQTRGYKFLQQMLTPRVVLPSLTEKFANEQGTKAVTYRSIACITLKVESFAGRNFHGDKLSRTPIAKIKFRGYKLSRTPSIFALFLYFRAVFIKF